MKKFLTNSYMEKLGWFAIFLGLSGSCLSIHGKIRLFHLGLIPAAMFIVVALYQKNRAFRLSIFIPPLVILALALVQLSWAKYPDRLFEYLIMVLIGMTYFSLAQILSSNQKIPPNILAASLIILWSICIFTMPNPTFDRPFGGAYGNVNDMMAAFFVLFCLFADSKTIRHALILICWSYALFTNRRAGLVGLILFFIYDCWPYKQQNLKRIALYSSYVIIAFAILHNNIRGFGFISNPDHIVAESSDGIRIHLIKQMWEIAIHSSPIEWLFGLGLGQLRLTSVKDGIPWDSPHFFLWEFTFYFGLLWPIALIFLLYYLPQDKRCLLITATIIFLGMSSVIYFMPFYIAMGFLYGYSKNESRAT